MKTLAVIPARWASSRFPGKPLAPILGRPMILHVCDRVARAEGVDALVVATDDERIAEVCRQAGHDVAMTDPNHQTGTDRMVEVARGRPAEAYVNVQGDEPLIDPAAIGRIVDCLRKALPRGIDVANACIDGATEEQKSSASVVHLVPRLDGCVLALSRFPVPYTFAGPFRHQIHVGLYAMTGEALERFAARPRGPVEQAESIEMMRFLEYGDSIAYTTIPPGSIGVDHPEDIARVEAVLDNGDS